MSLVLGIDPGSSTGVASYIGGKLVHLATIEQNDQLPPVATVCEHFGWRSLQAGQDHVDALLRHGLIERNAVGKLRFARGAR